VCDDDGVLRLIDSATGKSRAEIQTPEKGELVAQFSSDGTKLFSSTRFLGEGPLSLRAMRLWDVATGKEACEFEGEVEPSGNFISLGGDPHKYACSANGKWAAAVGRGETVWVWDAATGKKVTSFKLAESENGHIAFRVEGLSFTPDSSILAVCGERFGADIPSPWCLSVLYAAPSGRELVRLPGVKNLIFAPDGKTVAVVTGTEPSPSPPPSKADPDEVTICDLADLLKPQRPKEK
jgi:WD40 repeat protein